MKKNIQYLCIRIKKDISINIDNIILYNIILYNKLLYPVFTTFNYLKNI